MRAEIDASAILEAAANAAALWPSDAQNRPGGTAYQARIG